MKKLAEARLVVVSLVSVLAVSCGGDAGSADTTTPSEDITTTAATTPDDNGSAESGNGGLEGLSSTCLEAAQGMAAAIGAYSSGMAQAFGGSFDDESLQLSAEQLEAMAEAAPDEIKDDLNVIAEQLNAFYTALAESGYEPGTTPDADQIAELSALAESMDNEAFEAASDNINAWFEDNCEG